MEGGLGSDGVPRNDAKVFAALLAEEDNVGVADGLAVAGERALTGATLGFEGAPKLNELGLAIAEGRALTAATLGFEGAPKLNELGLAAVPKPPNEPNFGTAAGGACNCMRMWVSLPPYIEQLHTSIAAAPDVLWLPATRLGSPRILLRSYSY